MSILTEVQNTPKYVILKEIKNTKQEKDIAKEAAKEYARVTLINGKTLEGLLVSEDESWVTLEVAGSDVGLSRKEIKRFEMIQKTDA